MNIDSVRISHMIKMGAKELIVEPEKSMGNYVQSAFEKLIQSVRGR